MCVHSNSKPQVQKNIVIQDKLHQYSDNSTTSSDAVEQVFLYLWWGKCWVSSQGPSALSIGHVQHLDSFALSSDFLQPQVMPFARCNPSPTSLAAPTWLECDHKESSSVSCHQAGPPAVLEQQANLHDLEDIPGCPPGQTWKQHCQGYFHSEALQACLWWHPDVLGIRPYLLWGG